MFESAVLKVERANEHIQDLHQRFSAFTKSDLHRLWVEPDVRTGKPTLKLATPGLPRVAPLIIGDAVHNLHSAMDHLWWETTDALNRTQSDYTRFPFRGTRQEVIAAVDGGPEQTRWPTDIATLVIDVVRPYTDVGGDSPFAILHKLDILDKTNC